MFSLLRKLSIGGKVKDGMLPDHMMSTARELTDEKNQNCFIEDAGELRETVYGENYVGFVIFSGI